MPSKSPEQTAADAAFVAMVATQLMQHAFDELVPRFKINGIQDIAVIAGIKSSLQNYANTIDLTIAHLHSIDEYNQIKELHDKVLASQAQFSKDLVNTLFKDTTH